MQQRYLPLARMTARAMQRREQAAGAHMPRIMTEQDSESCSCSQQCSRWMRKTMRAVTCAAGKQRGRTCAWRVQSL